MQRFLRRAALVLCLAIGSATPVPAAAPPPPRPHNVILFVADGLRASIVDAKTAPAMTDVAAQGVRFADSHSVFPTFTTANASALATGHYLGDTGDFSNTLYAGFPLASARLSVTPFLENDGVLGEMDAHYGGNYLDEETLLAAARRAGFATAAIGKLGPTAIQDVTSRDGTGTIVIDDSTGHVLPDGSAEGVPLSAHIAQRLTQVLGTAVAPARGENGNSGDATVRGTSVPNRVQQQWFADAATRVVLPELAARTTPFVLVYWSRDPDGTQHNQGDSLGRVVPGINGPTSLAAIKDADDNLAALRAEVRALGLEATTDIVVTADHGFSTIDKASTTSQSTHFAYAGVPAKALPPGFLALDIGAALALPVSDPERDNVVVHPDLEGKFPSRGNALIGTDASHPDVIVAANGGSDLVYLPGANRRALARRVIDALLGEDYVSGLFVDDALGSYPGTLPLSAIGLKGTAVTPTPAIVVNFRSFDTGCGVPERCAAEVADTTLQQGQGMHGSFSRADTANFVAALGPDFKHATIDRTAMSNADLAITLAHLLGLKLGGHGVLVGRVLDEALEGGIAAPPTVARLLRSHAAANGRVTVLRYQDVGAYRYFDAAGFPGRTVGL
jgi:arylsulfatase A-like enzyme